MDVTWTLGDAEVHGPLPIPAVITMDEETTAIGAALHTQPALVVELDQSEQSIPVIHMRCR